MLSAILITCLACIFTNGVKTTPTPTSAVEIAPTDTVAAVVTETAAPETPTPTQAVATPTSPEPTQTPLPEATQAQPTSTPSTAKLSQPGPWLLIRTSDGLWAADNDGSALTQLTQTPILGPNDLQLAPSPDGKRVAFITGDSDGVHHLALNLMSMPDGTVKTVTALTNSATEPGPGIGPNEPIRAVTEVDSLAWSPDGQTLAFISAHDGASAELYSYSLDTGVITQLSKGSGQAYGPHWSPDGSYIVYFAVTAFGAGAGYSMAGGWAIRADGSGIITLFQTGDDMQEFDGWVSSHSFLINAWTPVCGPQDLRIYDLATQKELSLVKGCFTGAAVADYNGYILATGDGSNGSLKGLYSFSAGSPTGKQLSSDPAQFVQFLKQDGDFLVKFSNSQAIYSSSGEQVIQAPKTTCAFDPTLAAFGALYAWACDKGDPGLWVNGPGVPDAKVFNQASGFPAWSAKNTLFFISGGSLYRAPFPGFKPEPVGQITGDIQGVAWTGQP